MAIEDPMLLEWLSNRDLYEQWEKECKPAKVSKPKTEKKRILKVEVPTKVENRLAQGFINTIPKPAYCSSKMKVENGFFKWDYSNRYNIRVNNLTSLGSRSRLEQYVVQQYMPENPNVKSEGVKSEDLIACLIDKIDYSKQLPDFKLVPIDVVKTELNLNGIRSTIKKGEIKQKMEEIWQYRKHGIIPKDYTSED